MSTHFPCLFDADWRLYFNIMPDSRVILCCFCVRATCFFIDTSDDLLEYIAVIAHVLKPGGLWVNAGPLQCKIASGRLVHVVSLRARAQ